MPVTRDNTAYLTSMASSDGFPIILIHGAGGNALSWPPSLRHLPRQTVYTIDLAGHGNSKNNPYCGVQYYADQVLMLMDTLRLPKAILVGHSMGGGVALTIALDHPERVTGLGLISSAANLRLPSSIRDLTVHPETYPELVDLLMDLSFSKQVPRRTIQLVHARLLGERPTILLNDLQACEAFNLSDRISQITQPTLIMVGDNDQMTPLRHSVHFNNLIADSWLQILSNKGHMLPLEAPDELGLGIEDLANKVKQAYLRAL
ncbi:MAG TPA: alpha/beta hydrolase [Anaerolineales bacterium]|nr:alpha/beta hydrolase [Anaerolineales bacterium]